MKRLLASVVIAAYLGSLGYGIVCHTLNFNTASHPAMYFVVWDMFCGWSAYANRLHIIGEGESGRYYRLAPGPWDDFHPYGNLSRHEYDAFLSHAGRLSVNCLKQTRHEPMRRVFVVEESWAKKYNLPDDIWSQFFDEPKQRHSYFRIRRVMAPCGRITGVQSAWIAKQQLLVVSARSMQPARTRPQAMLPLVGPFDPAPGYSRQAAPTSFPSAGRLLAQ